VKYQWPELARVKFEISPDIHCKGKERSSRRATAWLRALTEMTWLGSGLLIMDLSTLFESGHAYVIYHFISQVFFVNT
jgi:hypothetical protein